LESRVALVVSCWLTMAMVSSVYMLVFGNEIGDIVFGVILPAGLLIIIATMITFVVLNSFESEIREKK